MTTRFEASYPSLILLVALVALLSLLPMRGQNSAYEFNDAHFHLTNYVQEGPDISEFVKIMGTKVGRVALFGIPLQQQWSYRISGENAPRYYLDTDAKLYYYSFVDAVIAEQYKSLPQTDQERFDPMITGFNPTDMYAVDHIRRVLKTYPGVFTGVGEFSIHKEFVASKIVGDVASLTDPALDRILDFAGESGLVVILHNDIDVPFPKPAHDAAYAKELESLFRRHANTTIIWAHIGLGRIVKPSSDQRAFVEKILSDPTLTNVYCDVSWDETAKYLVGQPNGFQAARELATRFPDRFIFGTDEVAPSNAESYMKVYEQYKPLLEALPPAVREKLLKSNYERVFGNGRRRVRVWEAENLRNDRKTE